MTCYNCGKPTNNLFGYDIPDPLSSDFELMPVPYCEDCFREATSTTQEKLINHEQHFPVKKERDFYIDLLKGRMGQVIVEAILRNSGFEIYPYGYESYFTNIIKDMVKKNGNEVVTQIRATPDLYVYDRERNRGFLLEIKTTTSGINHWEIESEKLEKYNDNWSNATLVVVHMRTLRIFCVKLSELKLDTMSIEESRIGLGRVYAFNLEKQFQEIYDYFTPLTNESVFKTMITKIKENIIDEFGANLK